MGHRKKGQPPRAKSLVDEPGFEWKDLTPAHTNTRGSSRWESRVVQQPDYDELDSIHLWRDRFKRFLNLKGNPTGGFALMYIKRLEKELGLGD